MKYSKLFGKTVRNAAKEEVSVNANLLTRGGFIRKEVAGVYNYLPLGLRVLTNISNIIREEMNTLAAQEVLLSALQNKQHWLKTKRWDSFDVLFKLKSQLNTEYALGPTHEEVLVPIATQFVYSYKDLPFSLYQIQVKFRDELRAKSGILRGREFLMKDMYSFHADEKDFDHFYGMVKKTYQKIFHRCGLKAILTQASGGSFSTYSHEYQVETEDGEDTIYYCPSCGFAENKEIATVNKKLSCVQCGTKTKEIKTIEVGNIFPLKTKFSDAFGLSYKDTQGKSQPVVMGCYGIGITRLMGAIVEVSHDTNGIIWPKEISPYRVHIVLLGKEVEKAEKVYNFLQERGIEVLFDDRPLSAGEKFADADLIGIPYRVVIAEKTDIRANIEMKQRRNTDAVFLPLEKIPSELEG